MVYLVIPKQLSEQERELQRKFSKLRKLRKQLANLKAANARQEENEKKNVKRIHSENAEAATEQAKKLLKAGAIKLDQSTRNKSFKRARMDRGSTSKDGSERQPQISNYKPYSVTDSQQGSAITSKPTKPNYRDSFVPASQRDTTPLPKRGPRVFVRGEGITETLLRQTFSKAGSISQISMENNKYSGFVTFDTVESADEAVNQFNGSMVEGVKLEVEIARRQRGTHQSRMNFDPNTLPSSKDSETPSTQLSRDVVHYDDDDMFG